MHLNSDAILGIVHPSTVRSPDKVPTKKIKDDDVAKISVSDKHQADIPDMILSLEEMEIDRESTFQDSRVWCPDEKGVKESIAANIITEMNAARHRTQLPARLTLHTNLPTVRSKGTRLTTIMKYDEQNGTYNVYDGDEEYDVNVDDFVLSTHNYEELIYEAVYRSSSGIDFSALDGVNVNVDPNKIHQEAINSFVRRGTMVHELSEIQAAEIVSLYPHTTEACKPWTTEEVILLCNALDKYRTDIRSAWKALKKSKDAPKRTVMEVIDFCYKNFPSGIKKDKLDTLKKVYLAKCGERPDIKELEENSRLDESSDEEDAEDREIKESIAEEIEEEGEGGFGVREIKIEWEKAWNILTNKVKWRSSTSGEKIRTKLEELGITESEELLLCNRAQLDQLCLNLKEIPRMSFYIAMNVRKN